MLPIHSGLHILETKDWTGGVNNDEVNNRKTQGHFEP